MDSLFDVYIAVDWSSRSKPSPRKPNRDAIWVALLISSSTLEADDLTATYWPTRQSCREFLRERLSYHSARRQRVFIGFDFPYGYSHGFATALGSTGEIPAWQFTWRTLSQAIIDEPNNNNNRFAVAAELNSRCGTATPGPFWGCPVKQERPTLEMCSPAVKYPYPARPDLKLERLRAVERRQRGVQPVWKLYGNGSVGSQSLVGIPVVSALRYERGLAAFSRVWPFETGFTSRPTPETGPFILHAEIWPGVVPGPLDTSLAIRDRAQVEGLVRWLRQLDTVGRLPALFDAPDGLTDEEAAAVIGEEGWFIGAGLGHQRRVYTDALSNQ